MIVLYWMTPDPVVVTPEKTLLEVVRLMKEHKIRRMPVVSDAGNLLGIIGRSDVYRWVRPDQILGEFPKSVAEDLAGHQVADQMSRPAATCDAYEYIEDVSHRMREDKLGAYPVLSRGHLVGIISESDLLRALAELAYHGGEGKRISVRVALEDKDDCLYNIVDLCRRLHLELFTVLTHPILDESAIMATLRVKGDSVDEFVRSLWNAGYKVVDES
ncbi:MAG: CBS domain-containing protein [Planctomycetota bacterium]